MIKLRKLASLNLQSRVTLPILGVGVFFALWVGLFVLYYARTVATDLGTDLAVKSLRDVQRLRNYYTRYVIEETQQVGLTAWFDHREKNGTVPFPATFALDVATMLTDESQVIEIYSPFPWKFRTDRQPLEGYQQEAWNYLTANAGGQFVRSESLDGQEFLRVAVADTLIADACVDCHNTHPLSPRDGWNLGDVRGVLEFRIPVAILEGNWDALVFYMTIFIVGLVALLIAVSLLTNRSASRLLRQFINRLGRERSGDAASDDEEDAATLVQFGKGELERSDLVGDLARAIDVFEKTQKELDVAQLRTSTLTEREQVRSAQIARLSKNFDDRIVGMIEAIQVAMRKIHDSASNMSSNAESTSKQIQLMTEATSQASENATRMSEAGIQLNTSIEEITSRVSSSRDIAANAQTQATETNKRIAGLAEAASRIGEVVNLINDIANQTNLLALNATIEAARAGESGRGFAVVASEVKNLANQTAQATEEISGQIQSVQQETNQAVEAIRQITAIINKINEVSDQVNEAVTNQGGTVRAISAGAGNTTLGTRRITTGLQDVAGSAQSTGQAATEVFADVEILQKQSQLLVNEIITYLEGMRNA